MSLASIYGAPEGFDALLLIRRAHEHAGTLLHVARHEGRMRRLAEYLNYFAPNIEVLMLPAWDCLPYDRVSPNPAVVSERIATLSRLLDTATGPRVVITTVNAAVQKVPPQIVFLGESLDVQAGSTIAPEKLLAYLDQHGYARADTVMEPGEYAMRGGIVDIFPSGEGDPVRLDFFGDTVESVRRFDPATQRSTEKANGFSLRPVSEVSLDAPSVTRFRTAWREIFGQAAATDPIYQAISEGRRFPGMEHWVPLFHEGMETLLDYLVAPSVSFDTQIEEALTARLDMIADHFDARKMVPRDGEMPYRALPPDRLYLDRAGWDAMFAGPPAFIFNPYGMPDGVAGFDAGGRPGVIFTQAGNRGFCKHLPAAGRPVGAMGGAGQAHLYRRLDAWLARPHRRPAGRTRLARRDFRGLGGRAKAEAGVIGLITLSVERGFVADSFAIVGEQDFSGRTHQPAAPQAQAGRPVHRRSHRNRRGRSGRASGLWHRPL